MVDKASLLSALRSAKQFTSGEITKAEAEAKIRSEGFTGKRFATGRADAVSDGITQEQAEQQATQLAAQQQAEQQRQAEQLELRASLLRQELQKKNVIITQEEARRKIEFNRQQEVAFAEKLRGAREKAILEGRIPEVTATRLEKEGFVRRPEAIENEKQRLEREAAISRLKPGELVITTIDPSTKRFNMGFGEATLTVLSGRTLSKTFEPIASALRGEETTSFLNLKEATGEFLSPFRYVGPLVEDVETTRRPRTPSSGTIETGFPITTTPREIRIEKEILAGLPIGALGKPPEAQASIIAEKLSNDLSTEFGEQLFKGEVTSEQIKKIGQERFETELSKIYSIRGEERKIFGDVGVTTGKRFTRKVGLVTEIGTITALSFTPIGATAVGAIFIAGAAQKSVQSGILFGKGEYKKSAIGLGKAGLFAAGGTVLISRVLGPTGKFAQQIDKLRLEELQSQRLRLLGEEIGKTPEGDVLLKLRAVRKTDVATQTIDEALPIFKTGEDTFSVVGGRGISEVKLTRFGLQGIVTPKEATTTFLDKFSLLGRGRAGPISKLGIGEVVITDPKKLFAATGEAKIVIGPRKVFTSKIIPDRPLGDIEGLRFTIKDFRVPFGKKVPELKTFVSVDKKEIVRGLDFGGVVKEQDKFFQVVSGPQVKLKVSEIARVKLQSLDTGDVLERVLLRKAAVVKPEATGFIKKLLPGDITISRIPEKVTFDIVSRGPSKLQLLSASNVLGETTFGTTLGLSTGTRVIPTVVTPSIVTTPTITTSIFGGGVVTEQISKVKGKVAPVVRVDLTSEVRTATIPKFAPSLKLKELQKSASKFRAGMGVIQGAGLESEQQSKLRQGISQRQKQKQKLEQSLKMVVPLVVSPRISPKVIPEIVGIGGIGFGLPKKIVKTKIGRPGRFTVFVRRFGKFKPIATVPTSRRAFEIGRGEVERTLGATFKIEGKGLMLRTPKGFKRKGGLFIERKERRLKRRGISLEVPEIQAAKRRKGGKKR